MKPYKLAVTLFVIILVIGVLTPLMTSVVTAKEDKKFEPDLSKIDPKFLAELQKRTGKVRVMVLLVELPQNLRAEVTKANDRETALKFLKLWAAKTQSRVANFIYLSGGKVLKQFWIMNAMLVEVDVDVVYMLTSLPEVRKIVPNFIIRVPEPIEKKEIGGKQVSSWGIFKIRAPEAWELGYLGEGVRVCVIDTGVDITHPALAGKMLTLDPTSPYYPGGWMEFDDAGNPVLSTPHDTHGHGTHVSGTALGGNTEDILIGVAPNATLMHALALPGGGGTFAQVLAAMEWCVEPFYIDPDTGEQIPTDLPGHVVSMSWGASNYYGNELLPAIENMLLANIVPVAAIGNDGPDTTSNPGNIWGTFGIGATDQNDNVAPWSSGAVVNWPEPPEEWPFFGGYPETYIKPDFSAPGVDITSSVPGGGYEAWSGTSMATPHVSGTVALILQALDALDYTSPDPSYSIPELVYIILNQTCIDFGDPGQDIRYGWGRIDAYEAVLKAREYAKKSGVEGYVLDSETGEPIPWATITVLETGKTYKVNASGYFKIPLDPGIYHLNVSAWGYYWKVIEVEVVLLNGTITGTVTDAITGEPIEGANVTVLELNASTLTDTEGHYSISVPPGTYTVKVFKEGYQEAETIVTVDENETVIVDFALYPSAIGTIEAYVYDNETGLPIAEAIVTVIELGLSNTTNEEGYTSIVVPTGNYSVKAEASGYYPETITGVLVPPNETVTLEFYLQPIPPTVAVVGNVDYATAPHIAQILSEAGFNVIEYSDITELIDELNAGNPNNIKVVVIDHWKSDTSLPDNTTVIEFLTLADTLGIGVVFLGAPYSGYTGMKALYVHESDVEAAGYPAPDSRYYEYPLPDYVYVIVATPMHPIFEGVEYDGPAPYSFYVANLTESWYCDYSAYNFTDDTDIIPLAAIYDEYNVVAGVQVAIWNTSMNVTWVYISTGAESVWMQYREPGGDGMYSTNLERVLVNAVNYSLITALGVQPLKLGPMFKAEMYTYVEVYLDRLPYGYLEGYVYDRTTGEPIAGAKVVVENTPLVLTTDENGYFSHWLPVGNYTVTISAAGYATESYSVTIYENETTTIEAHLKRIPRIAIMYDYASQIKTLIEETLGWYAVDYTDYGQLLADLQTGFYDVAIFAGYYNVPLPDKPTMDAILETAEELGIGLVFLDNWGNYGYGINILHTLYNDPAQRGYAWGDGYVYMKIIKPHPIFKGWNVGDVIVITYASDADYSWFGEFNGTTIALVGSEERGIVGDGIAYRITESGNKWILMAAMAPESWTPMDYWTDDAKTLLLNAIKWVLSKPLNVTVTPEVAHVGDVVTVTATGAYAGAELIIKFDGMEIARATADEEGKIVVDIVVPNAAFGKHLVEVATEDEMYYGSAYLMVVTGIELVTTEVKQADILEFNLTGLPAYTSIHVSIDDNTIGVVVSNEVGFVHVVINVPDFIKANYQHVLKAKYENGTIAASATITVLPGGVTEAIEETKEELSSKIDSLSSSLTSRITSAESRILNALSSISKSISSVESAVTSEVSSLRSDISSVKAAVSGLDSKLSTLMGMIEGVASTSGNLSATLSEIKSSLTSLAGEFDDVMKAISDVSTKVGAVNASLASMISKEASSIKDAISKAVSDLSGKVSDEATDIITSITTKIDETYSRLSGDLKTVPEEIKASIGESETRIVDSIKGLEDSIAHIEDLIKSLEDSLSAKVSEVSKKTEPLTTTGNVAAGASVVAAVSALAAATRVFTKS